MTLSVASFKVRFPEFAQTPTALIETALADAYRNCDERVYGEKLDQAAGFYAADQIATSPFGMQARLETDDSVTTYWVQYERLARSCAGGAWLL